MTANEPAFPGDGVTGWQGMSTRQCLAAEAMNAILGGKERDGQAFFYFFREKLVWIVPPAEVARLAYEMADALIQEGQKSDP